MHPHRIVLLDCMKQQGDRVGDATRERVARGKEARAAVPGRVIPALKKLDALLERANCAEQISFAKRHYPDAEMSPNKRIRFSKLLRERNGLVRSSRTLCELTQLRQVPSQPHARQHSEG